MKYIIVTDIYDVDEIIEDRFKRYDSYYKLFDNTYIIEAEKNYTGDLILIFKKI